MNKEKKDEKKKEEIGRSDNLAPLFSPRRMKGVKSYIPGIIGDNNTGVANESSPPGKNPFF